MNGFNRTADYMSIEESSFCRTQPHPDEGKQASTAAVLNNHKYANGLLVPDGEMRHFEGSGVRYGVKLRHGTSNRNGGSVKARVEGSSANARRKKRVGVRKKRTPERPKPRGDAELNIQYHLDSPNPEWNYTISPNLRPKSGGKRK